jgi:hypothetical protein
MQLVQAVQMAQERLTKMADLDELAKQVKMSLVQKKNRSSCVET